MHTTIRIKNFRSIEDALFTVKPGINVLVGPNGSGKTNVLHALKFVSSLLTSGAAVAMGKAGGPARNFRRGSERIDFIVVTHYETSVYHGKKTNFMLRWDVSIAISRENYLVYILNESIRILDSEMKDVIRVEVNRGGGGQFKVNQFMEDERFITMKMINAPGVGSGGPRKSDLYQAVKGGISNHLASMKKAPPDASILPSFRWIHRSIDQLLLELISFDEYNIQPDVSRLATDPLPITRMGNDGRGVAEVINALESEQTPRISRGYDLPYYYDAYRPYPFVFYQYSGFHQFNQKTNPLQDIAENIRAAVSTIDGIGTRIDPSSGKRYVVFKSGDNEFRPEEVSDGTMKWLCLLVAVFVPHSRVIVLEEPENFMHPWMQQRFITLIREQARKAKRSVILTTHSATILNSLQIKELFIVRRDSAGTRVDEIKDKNSLQNMLDSTNFGLGDAWVSGAIGGVSGG
jgi:predicted ATPase